MSAFGGLEKPTKKTTFGYRFKTLGGMFATALSNIEPEISLCAGLVCAGTGYTIIRAIT